MIAGVVLRERHNSLVRTRGGNIARQSTRVGGISDAQPHCACGMGMLLFKASAYCRVLISLGLEKIFLCPELPDGSAMYLQPPIIAMIAT
jgi:hypothetical protein